MDFAPGDRVKVIHMGSSFYDIKGTVIKVFQMENRPDLEPSIHVAFDRIPEALKGIAEAGPAAKTFVFSPKALAKVKRLQQPPGVYCSGPSAKPGT